MYNNSSTLFLKLWLWSFRVIIVFIFISISPVLSQTSNWEETRFNINWKHLNFDIQTLIDKIDYKRLTAAQNKNRELVFSNAASAKNVNNLKRASALQIPHPDLFGPCLEKFQFKVGSEKDKFFQKIILKKNNSNLGSLNKESLVFDQKGLFSTSLFLKNSLLNKKKIVLEKLKKKEVRVWHLFIKKWIPEGSIIEVRSSNNLDIFEANIRGLRGMYLNKPIKAVKGPKFSVFSIKTKKSDYINDLILHIDNDVNIKKFQVILTIFTPTKETIKFRNLIGLKNLGYLRPNYQYVDFQPFNYANEISSFSSTFRLRCMPSSPLSIGIIQEWQYEANSLLRAYNVVEKVEGVDKNLLWHSLPLKDHKTNKFFKTKFGSFGKKFVHLSLELPLSENIQSPVVRIERPSNLKRSEACAIEINLVYLKYEETIVDCSRSKIYELDLASNFDIRNKGLIKLDVMIHKPERIQGYYKLLWTGKNVRQKIDLLSDRPILTINDRIVFGSPKFWKNVLKGKSNFSLSELDSKSEWQKGMSEIKKIEFSNNKYFYTEAVRPGVEKIPVLNFNNILGHGIIVFLVWSSIIAALKILRFPTPIRFFNALKSLNLNNKILRFFIPIRFLNAPKSLNLNNKILRFFIPIRFLNALKSMNLSLKLKKLVLTIINNLVLTIIVLALFLGYYFQDGLILKCVSLIIFLFIMSVFVKSLFKLKSSEALKDVPN